MPEPNPTPTPVFAIVGHPNEGKSSVVATLAEDDRVRISAIPGETVVCQPYPVKVNGQEIVRFVDTPGFQHPQALLTWLQNQPATSSNLAAAFRETHRDDPAYAQDLELLEPLAQGSGVIYVVDGSRPVRRHDLAEMESLRLLGNPRMAVINPKQHAGPYLEAWRVVCAKNFNATRVFNAWHASYAERIALLETLKGMQQEWEPALARAIRAFQEDWSRRNARVAGIMADLLRDAVRHTESKSVFQPNHETEARQSLTHRYQETISRLENRAQTDIRHLFKHNIFNLTIPPQSILQADLFTEKTWQLLGLNRRQILLAAAALGAGLGVKLDLVFGQLTFGLFTLSGAALATAAAWFKGENMARIRLKHLQLGGVQFTIGPNQNPQFPFVLLDRLLLYYEHTIHWTHARRDPPPAVATKETELKLGFTARWPKERRQACLDYLKALAGTDLTKLERSQRAFIDMIQGVLKELSEPPPA